MLAKGLSAEVRIDIKVPKSPPKNVCSSNSIGTYLLYLFNIFVENTSKSSSF